MSVLLLINFFFVVYKFELFKYITFFCSVLLESDFQSLILILNQTRKRLNETLTVYQIK